MGLGCGLLVVVGQGAPRLGRRALRHECCGGGGGDGGRAPCSELLLLGLGWLGPKVVEDVLGALGSGCRRAHCEDLPGPLGPFGKAPLRPAKVLVAAADGE